MIQEVIKKWEENKHRLENYFRTAKQEDYNCSYLSILKNIVVFILNSDESLYGENYSVNDITVVDDGDLSGNSNISHPKRNLSTRN